MTDVGTLINYFVAIAIPAFAVYLIFALDLFGTGKRSTVFLSLAWGAVGSYVLARLVNDYVVMPVLGYETVTTLTGPIAEEIIKAMVLVYLIGRPRFRYIVDGAVYGFAIGIGFSVTENLIVYLPLSQGAPVVGVLSRVLSTSLMHATASALVGIALGRLRRASSAEKLGWPIIGIGLAVVIHVTYNNIVARLSGPALLLIAIALGFIGFALIFFLISQGLAEEKKHFAQTLGLNVGVSSSERRAVQQLGGDAIEQILKELAEFFGEDKIAKIRRLLVIQANIGILQNNLNSQVSDRLRKAWQEEIKTLRAENNQLRHSLGLYVMSFLRGVFPEGDEDWSDSFSQQIRKSDPTQIHSFDIFMRASEAAKTVTAEELERTAGMLQRAEIFKDVSLADLENLSRAVTTHIFQRDEVLFNEGDEGDTLYMIRQGQINLFRRDQSGEEKPLGTCGVGDVVGELALLDGYPRSAQARAADHVVALRLRREHFMMFVQSRPQVMIAVLRFLANRVRNTTHVLEATTAWATSLAQGNYQEARHLGVLANSAEIAAPDLPMKPAEMPDEREQQSLSSTGAMRLGGAFSKIAVALEQREKIIMAGAESTGHHLLEMDDMPETHKRVINLLLRDPIAASRGLSQDVLRSKLDDMEGLPIILEDLDKNGWLIIVGEPPDTRYKVNLHRRRGRTLDSQRVWTKLNKDYT